MFVGLALTPAGAAAEPDGAPNSEFFAGYERIDELPPRAAPLNDTVSRPPPPVPVRPTHFTDRPLALEAMLGAGTPVGLVGGVLEYSLVDPVAIGAGVGTGVAGPEGAVILNLRPLFWNGRAAHAIGATLAWSGGNWDDSPVEILPDMGHQSSEARALEQHRTYTFAQWVQVDAGYELRTRGGFSLRVAYGVAWLAAPGDYQCRVRNGTEVPCSAGQQENTPKPFSVSIPTMTLSLGYAFEL